MVSHGSRRVLGAEFDAVSNRVSLRPENAEAIPRLITAAGRCIRAVRVGEYAPPQPRRFFKVSKKIGTGDLQIGRGYFTDFERRLAFHGEKGRPRCRRLLAGGLLTRDAC